MEVSKLIAYQGCFQITTELEHHPSGCRPVPPLERAGPVAHIGRIMALNKLIYHDIPHVPTPGGKPATGPHPYKASHRHQYWFIDGRRMDFALGGVRWWSLIILEGHSRTMLAGMIAPTEATWVALMVLYTACLRYGAPEPLVSDSGGAYTSADFEAVCTRLQIHHETIVSTQGESYQNLMETHFNIQRRSTTISSRWPAPRRSSSSATRRSSRPITPPRIRGS